MNINIQIITYPDFAKFVQYLIKTSDAIASPFVKLFPHDVEKIELEDLTTIVGIEFMSWKGTPNIKGTSDPKTLPIF